MLTPLRHSTPLFTPLQVPKEKKEPKKRATAVDVLQEAVDKQVGLS